MRDDQMTPCLYTIHSRIVLAKVSVAADVCPLTSSKLESDGSCWNLESLRVAWYYGTVQVAETLFTLHT
jgi:hypothetical protein